MITDEFWLASTAGSWTTSSRMPPRFWQRTWEWFERNELEVNLRFYVETQLVPGLLAVNALLLQASSDALKHDLPKWLE